MIVILAKFKDEFIKSKLIEKGCTLEVHDGRMIKTDLVGKKHKYYTSVDRLMKHSKLFAKHANNVTVEVTHNGTDCKNSKVVKL